MAISIPRLTSHLSAWLPWLEKEKFKELPKGSNKRYSYQIKEHKVFKFDVDQQDLKNAIMQAEDETDPRRIDLIQIYREVMRDLHVRSQIETACNKVISKPWAIVNEETYEINEEATRLLQKKWFEKLRSLYVKEEFDGYKLAEFGQFRQTKYGWELIDVKEFPPQYVLPERGIIIANPWAQKGIPFRPDELKEDTAPELKKLAEDAATFFIEIGDRENLGLLQYVAPNSIYKRYAKGDWARSSEKWIDPVTIIRSGSDDDTENDKKAESAANMGNNSWMILDKDDEVELMERKNANGFETTKQFLEYLDADNSKGINGQVATSDEKSFVGSAEVQERILGDYSDKRIRSMTYWINEDVIPKLIDLNNGNSAYKILDGNMFLPLEHFGEEEDDSIDTEQEEKSQTNNLNAGRGSSLGKSVTKPRSLSANAFGLIIDYGHSCGHEQCNEVEVVNSIDINELLRKYLDKVFNRSIRSGEIDKDVAKANADAIWKSVKQGFDSNLTDVKFGSAAHRLKAQLHYNVYVMAAFKNHHNTLEIFNQLFDESGNIKSFSKFRKDVQEINAKYNKKWLRAEYNLGRANARMASKWMKYEDRGGSLVYETVLDGRVRPEHEVLHGATYPVDHPFWQTYYPPNGWGCRCDVRWIRTVEEKAPNDLPEVKPEHRNNAGITGRIFPPEHPYFEVQQVFEQKATEIFGMELPVDLPKFIQNMALHDTLKDNLQYKLLHTNVDNGGFVFQHVNHGKDELAENLKVGKRLADRGESVILKPVGNQASNDALVSGVEYEFKKAGKFTNIARTVQSAFREARRQNAERLIYKVNATEKDTNNIIKGLKYGFRYSPEIKEVEIWVTNKDNEQSSIDDSEVKVNAWNYVDLIKKALKD